MKVAIPTNDRKTIAVHTGRANEFLFCVVENGAITNQYFETNQHTCRPHNSHESPEEMHEDLLQQLGDVNKVMYYAMGKHLRESLKHANIEIERSKQVELREILSNLVQ